MNDYEDDYEDDSIEFADPGGDSALRASSSTNPRVYNCPTCNGPNLLTAQDMFQGYQCNACAYAIERGGY